MVSAYELQSTVNFLTADALDGRLMGSVGEECAIQYIADYLRS